METKYSAISRTSPLPPRILLATHVITNRILALGYRVAEMPVQHFLAALNCRKYCIPDNLFSKIVCLSFTEKASPALLLLRIPPLFISQCPSNACLFAAILWQPPGRKRTENHRLPSVKPSNIPIKS